LSEQKTPCVFDLGRVALSGAADQPRHEHQQLLARIVVHGILHGLNVCGDRRGDAGPCVIDTSVQIHSDDSGSA
jgi:hypothetical protein